LKQNELTFLESKVHQGKKVHFFMDGSYLIATRGKRMIRYPLIDEEVELVKNELLKKF